MKVRIYKWHISAILIIVLVSSLLVFNNMRPFGKEEGKIEKGTFTAFFHNPHNSISLKGSANHHVTASSLSIYLNERNNDEYNEQNKNQCGIHLGKLSLIDYINKTSETDSIIINVESKDSLQTRVVCVSEISGQKERLGAGSGFVKISELESNYIIGELDIIMKGAMSGEKYRFEGSFVSLRSSR